jgi:hypothetical protein
LCPWPTGSSTTRSSLCWVTLWRRFTADGMWWCTGGRGVCCCGRLHRWYVRLSVEQHKQNWKSKQNSYHINSFSLTRKIADITLEIITSRK